MPFSQKDGDAQMAELTSRQLRRLFFAIEVNLLLWLGVCAALWSSDSVEAYVKQFATAGAIVSVLLQHWAYHNLYQRSKKSGSRSAAKAKDFG